jgi:hypothetical protein
VHNCHLVNCNQQFIKGSSSDNDSVGATDGRIEQCLFEFTNGWAYQSYTGGIDIHKGVNWAVCDNRFQNIRTPPGQSGIAEHAIHFWKRCPTLPQNIRVERNWIINCDRGIGYGLSNAQGGLQGGTNVIRNNMVYNDGTGSHTDVGVGLEYASDVAVDNNTVIVQKYWAPVEYRFPGSSNLVFRNNLVNGPIQLRDAAPKPVLAQNLERVEKAWFRDLTAGDLRLTSAPNPALGTGQRLESFQDDVDRLRRGSRWDIGASQASGTAAAVAVIPLPGLTIDGQPARAHTQGLEIVDGKYYVTARQENISPKRALLLRAESAGWTIWDITPPLPPGGGASLDHPGGMQSDGERLWIPVAQSVRHGRSVVRAFVLARLSADQPAAPDVEFPVADHIGAIAVNPGQRLVFGANWDTETVYVWDFAGHLQRTLSGQDMKTRHLGVVAGPDGRNGVAVQDWKVIGDRLFASGLGPEAGSSAVTPRSRLLVYRRFLEPDVECQTIVMPQQDGVELGQEAMAVSGGYLLWFPEDLGASNRLFRATLDELRIPGNESVKSINGHRQM